MSFLGGLGSGLARGAAAAGTGYLGGEIKGEAEGYRRQQQQSALDLKRQLAALATKPQKEELPFEVQSFLKTREGLFGPGGSAEERNQWQASGNEDTYQVVTHALAYGPEAARIALAIRTQPHDADTAPLEARLHQIIQSHQGGAAEPQFDVRPGGRPYNYTPSLKEQAGTGYLGARTTNTNAQTERIQQLTPLEVEKLKAETTHIGNADDLGQRRLNLDIASKQFDQAIQQFHELTTLGQGDYRLQAQAYGDLLSAAGRVYLNGGDPSKALGPLLFRKGALGAQTPNNAAITEYMRMKGFDDNDISRILGGLGGHIPGDMPGGGAPGGAPATAGTGGAPPLPPVAGIGPENPALASAAGFAGGQGYHVTSTTGGEHNPGSLHYQGRALDVSVRGKDPGEVKRFMAQAQAQGYVVRDERARPKGQAVWGGPHLHLEWGPNTKPGAAQALGFQGPGAGGDQAPGGPAGMGINTPATSPKVKNPYQPNTLEGQIFDIYTSGVPAARIIARFKGTPNEAVAQSVVDSANTQQREGGLFKGIPVPDRNGARIPQAPDLSGLAYPVGGGVAKQATSPVEPTAGFGQQPALAVEMPGGSGGGSNVTITEKVPPSGTRQFHRENTPLNARGGVSFRAPEKAGPARDLTISPPPAARSPQSMGPATKAPKQGAGAQAMSLNPLSAGFKAGQDTRAAFDEGGVKQLVTPQPGSGMSRLVQAFKEALGPTGFDEVKIRKAPAGSIYDSPALKNNEGLKGWNNVFRPWAQRMGYTTVDQVLSASKWYFAQEDRLRRPPYSLTEAEAEKQLKMALESFANAPGKALRLSVPKTGGGGNPRIATSQGAAPGTVEYRGKGR